jgi:HEAT repeat protein
MNEFSSLNKNDRAAFHSVVLEKLDGDNSQKLLALNVIGQISLSIPKNVKRRYCEKIINACQSSDGKVRSKAADLLRFINDHSDPHQPAKTLLALLDDADPNVVDRAAVSLEFNCRELPDDLWMDIVRQVDRAFDSGITKKIDGALFFYGNVRIPRTSEDISGAFLQKILIALKHNSHDVRGRAFSSLSQLAERIPRVHHQAIIDEVVQYVKVDRSVDTKTLAETLKYIQGELPPTIEERIQAFYKLEEEKLAAFQMLEMRRHYDADNS